MEPVILEHILHERENPMELSIHTLERITDKFSEEREIGRGEFAIVYKGTLPNGNVIVKRIMNSHTIDEDQFYQNVRSLLKVDHRRIARFLGYCATTEYKAVPIEGSRGRNFAKIRERLLCYEYISNGSLQKHITDELRGLEWTTRFKIIKGICEALHYLHSENHTMLMHLKPDNILLDDHMVPKLTDVGVSKLYKVPQNMNPFRSPAYCAPDFVIHGTLSAKSNIYSLGFIIMELVTGNKSIPDINNVLRKWRHRWRKTGKETPLGYRQVIKCIELGILCRHIDPKQRPSIGDVLRYLKKDNSMVDPIIHYSTKDDMLAIEPLELHFPFELNKQISCPLELTNKTCRYIAFNIKSTSPLTYFIEPSKGIVPPGSKCSVKITLQYQEKAPEFMHQAYSFITQSIKVQHGLAVEDITADSFEEEACKVDEVNLDVVFEAKKLQNDIPDVRKLEISCPFEPDNKTPIVLTLEHLKSITDDFSTKSELGRGGYGVVYKGVFSSGEIVAVKKLFAIHIVQDDQFRDEVSHLMGIKHRNVVQTLGYCAETSWDLIPQSTGRPIWAETPKRLICFEYVPNKSLDKYISDESLGLEWKLRYKIIEGICKGLHFLHEECHIVHLDIKPENILMDAAMVPKIADFGLSKIFGDQQTRLIIPDTSRAGSAGYMAPEYMLHGIVSIRADIFSLGVLIIQIVTGHREYPLSSAYFKLLNENHCPQSIETSIKDYTKRVVVSWMKKFASTLKYEEVKKYTIQVKKCIDIALNCVDIDAAKRPTAKDIIQVLHGVEQAQGSHERDDEGFYFDNQAAEVYFSSLRLGDDQDGSSSLQTPIGSRLMKRVTNDQNLMRRLPRTRRRN